MAGKRAKSKGSISFGLSLFIVGVIAVVTGYFLGNYYIKLAISPGTGAEVQTSTPASSSRVQAPVSPVKEVQPLPEMPVVKEEAPVPEENLLQTIEDDRYQTQGSYSNDIPSTADGLIRVRVGAYQARPEAMEMAKKLQAAGYPTYITTERPYRIQVGAFKDQKAAKALVDELVSKGFAQVILE